MEKRFHLSRDAGISDLGIKCVRLALNRRNLGLLKKISFLKSDPKILFAKFMILAIESYVIFIMFSLQCPN